MTASKRFETWIKRLGWSVLFMIIGVTSILAGKPLYDQIDLTWITQYQERQLIKSNREDEHRDFSRMLHSQVNSQKKEDFSKELGIALSCSADAPGYYGIHGIDAAFDYLESTPAGNQLWIFCSPAEDWRGLGGRFGLARIKDGKMVDALLLLMN